MLYVDYTKCVEISNLRRLANTFKSKILKTTEKEKAQTSKGQGSFCKLFRHYHPTKTTEENQIKLTRKIAVILVVKGIAP